MRPEVLQCIKVYNFFPFFLVKALRKKREREREGGREQKRESAKSRGRGLQEQEI